MPAQGRTPKTITISKTGIIYRGRTFQLVKCAPIEDDVGVMYCNGPVTASAANVISALCRFMKEKILSLVDDVGLGYGNGFRAAILLPHSAPSLDGESASMTGM